MSDLRPYQVDLIARVQAAYREGAQAVCAQCPTGAGKTHLSAAGIIAPSLARGRRTLFLADLEEILIDTRDRLRALGLPAAAITRGRAEDPTAPVQVASQQTLTSWLSRGIELPPADRVILDECHGSSATTTRALLAALRGRGARLLGLSVGPDSWVEMRGGPMGAGYVGPIEGAYDAVLGAGVQPEPLGTFDCLRVDALGIEARGWNGHAFAWKPVKSMLRHACDRPVRTLRVAGAELLVTDDHAVYRVEGKRGGSCEFVSRLSAEFSPGDVVAVDAGDGWTGAETPIDVLSLIEMDGVQVAVDLGGATRASLGMTPKRWYAARNRGAHGHHLAAAVYRRSRSALPRAEKLYTEGARGHWIAPSFLLSDWAYVLGFWLGNGWVNGGRVCFSVKNADADRFEAVLRALPHVEWNVSRRPMRGSVEFRCSCAPAAALFRALLGRVEAPEKFIPAAWITTWPETARRALIDGLMDSDGHAAVRDRGRERCHFTTTSLRLARGLLALLRSVGVSGSLHRRSNSGEGGVIDGRQIVGRRATYSVHWSLHALRGDNGQHCGARSRFDHGDKSFRESVVRATTPCEAPTFVYDLEMSGHPSFVADGVLVHNTATPARGDGQPLDEFDALVCGPSMCDLIALGALVRPEVLSPDRYLEKGVAEDPARIAWAAGRRGRRACIFVPTAAEADRVAGLLTQHGQPAAAVLDGMARDERRAVRDRLASGALQHVVTVRALQKGFDAPVLDTAILASGGSTIVGFLQSIGRVLRPCPGKPGALVYDLRGYVYLHGLPEQDRVWSLEGSQGRTASERAPDLRRCRECHAVFEPRTRCPRCGSVLIADPRPMRVQRAELYAQSGVAPELRAARYVEAVERRMVERGMPVHVAGRIAREKAPAWVREALAAEVA